MTVVVYEGWVRDQAMGALSGWLPGYTEPAEGTDEIQYRIQDVSEHDDDVMTISVEPANLFDAYYGDQPVRYFTVDVVVQELEARFDGVDRPPLTDNTSVRYTVSDVWLLCGHPAWPDPLRIWPPTREAAEKMWREEHGKHPDIFILHKTIKTERVDFETSV